MTLEPTHHFAVLSVAVCLSALTIVGCATNDEYWETADFGNSVRHTIALQTANAGSSGTGLDGAKAQTVLNAYRQDVAAPKSAERDIILRMSGN
jgi:hypothetical protein